MRIGIDGAILAERTRHSGIGRYVATLVERLPRVAPDDAIVLFTPEREAPPDRLPPNVTWITLPGTPVGKLSMLAAYQWYLPRAAARCALDVFHAPTVHPRPTWPSVPRRMPCPIVVTVHDIIPLTFYGSGTARLPWRQRVFYRWNLAGAARAARVISVSEASRRELIEQLRFAPERVEMVHNGVEVPPSRELTGDRMRPYILYVGSFEARKNLQTAVRAFGRVAQELPQHKFVVVAANGSGDRTPIDDEIRRCDLMERIRFHERVTNEQLRSLYRNADALTFPSFAEGFGLPPLEAMACGTPVIASAISAHREVLGNAAVFVAPEDAGSLAEAILRVTRDGALRARMSELGLRQAVRYPVDEFVQKTLDVYRAVATPLRQSAREAALMTGRTGPR